MITLFWWTLFFIWQKQVKLNYVLVNFDDVVLIPKVYKYPRISFVSQNILENCHRRAQYSACFWWRHSYVWDILIQIYTLFWVAVFGVCRLAVPVSFFVVTLVCFFLFLFFYLCVHHFAYLAILSILRLFYFARQESCVIL